MMGRGSVCSGNNTRRGWKDFEVVTPRAARGGRWPDRAISEEMLIPGHMPLEGWIMWSIGQDSLSRLARATSPTSPSSSRDLWISEPSRKLPNAQPHSWNCY